MMQMLRSEDGQVGHFTEYSGAARVLVLLPGVFSTDVILTTLLVAFTVLLGFRGASFQGFTLLAAFWGQKIAASRGTTTFPRCSAICLDIGGKTGRL